MAATLAITLVRVIAVALSSMQGIRGGGTMVGFYAHSCPKAESIVQGVMARKYARDKTAPAGLLRLLFHDSFVRGADASILLNSTGAEKHARPNLSLRGFEIVDEAKEALEAACPAIVSCADIIPLLVRDGIALAGGPKYEVMTGRRDGLISLEADTDILPDPAFPVTQAKEAFLEKGLTAQDFVVLLGAHTIGTSLCGFFSDRMFNFHGTGGPDPSMNASLVVTLSKFCPNPFFTESRKDPLVSLDQGTPYIFDSGYYHQLLLGNGILMIDAELPGDQSTAGLVHRFTDRNQFFSAFVQSITKLSNLGVLTGTQGEVRRKCYVVNSSPHGHPPPFIPPHTSPPFGKAPHVLPPLKKKNPPPPKSPKNKHPTPPTPKVSPNHHPKHHHKSPHAPH